MKSSKAQKIWKRTDYEKRRDYYLERDRIRRTILRDIIIKKKDVPCMDCNIKYPFYVMEFDHRNPEDKLFNVSDLRVISSEKKLLQEIDKCDVVCSNCHKIRHHLGKEQREAVQDGTYIEKYFPTNYERLSNLRSRINARSYGCNTGFVSCSLKSVGQD